MKFRAAYISTIEYPLPRNGKARLGPLTLWPDQLGIAHRGKMQALLDQRWIADPLQPIYNRWLSWQSRAHAGARDGRGNFKLYVSPHPNALNEAFGAAVEALSGSSAYSFKVGGDVYGLLRPDKLVAYFEHETANPLFSRTAIQAYPAPNDC